MVNSNEYQSSKKLAESYGFTTIDKHENGCVYAHSFEKQNRHVWLIVDKRMGGLVWQTADLVDGKLINHKKFLTLKEAFERE